MIMSNENGNSLFDYKKFSDDINNKLKYGDTLRPISRIIGIGLSTFHRIVKYDGKSTMSIDNVIKICNWLEKPITDYVLEYKIEKEDN
jgi:hypothetical protein